MAEFLRNLLASRAFWTGLGPAIVAFCNLIGHPLGTEKEQALGVILSAIGGWLGVTVTRAASGKPTSYKRAEQKAEDAIEDAKYGIYS